MTGARIARERTLIAMTTTAKDTAKFKELVLYVACKSEGDDTFGAAKLNRILFYIDFFSYLTLGQSISGGYPYVRGDFGPIPADLEIIKDEMSAAGDIAIRPDDYPGHAHGKVFALRQATIDAFTAREIELIERCIARFWNVSAARLTEVSEELAMWTAFDVGEEIPYSIVLVHRRPLTQEEIEYGLSLEPLAKAFLNRRNAG